jgi:hypothetical protein
MNFDILMPAILFAVTFVAMFLGKRAESKLKDTVEEREFKPRDTALLVVMIAVALTVVLFIPSMAIMALFLFSYSSLLFTVSYAFSDMRGRRMMLYCGVFIIAGILAGAAGFLGVIPQDLRIYGTLAFAGLAICASVMLVFVKKTVLVKPKWYVAALSPILFLLLFGFYGQTKIGFVISGAVSFQQFPYLLDLYGIIFAILIVLYLNTLFNWKTVFIFAGFLTGMDIVLVWITGTMVQAAEHISGLGLPVLVAFPTVPVISSTAGILIMRLGLGDFFFAGILASQTLKHFGKKTAIVSLLTICISFGLFELILLNKSLSEALPVPALPATLPILLGWLPAVAAKMFVEKRRKSKLLTKDSTKQMVQ